MTDSMANESAYGSEVVLKSEVNELLPHALVLVTNKTASLTAK